MQQRNKIFLSIIIFFISYFIFLILWIQIKSFYGYGLAKVGSKLAAITMNCKISSFKNNGELTKITFSKLISTTKGLGKLTIDVDIAVSKYSFNIPLTLALMASFFIFFRWKKRTLFEAIFLLILVHLLYVYSFCCVNIYHTFVNIGLINLKSFPQIFWESLWTFTDNFIIRFEPFLLIIYIWFREK